VPPKTNVFFVELSLKALFEIVVVRNFVVRYKTGARFAKKMGTFSLERLANTNHEGNTQRKGHGHAYETTIYGKRDTKAKNTNKGKETRKVRG
jgi:hypothetical protein